MKEHHIEWKPAHPKNHFVGRGGHNPIAIVDHIMAGSLNATTGWFHNPASGASTHFGVGKDGRIHQYVAVKNAAYGNGPINKPDMSVPWIAECVAKKINPNFVTISIEHEGQSGDHFTEQMYQATLWLHEHLITTYNIPRRRENISGHNQLDNVNRHFCPGKGFPWERLMQDLGITPKPEPEKPNLIDDNGYLVIPPMSDFYYLNDGWKQLGHPESGMTGELKPGYHVQRFEHAGLQYPVDQFNRQSGPVEIVPLENLYGYNRQ